jgi:hypothetical protein
MREPVRIANCSGFFGDRLAAAREQVEGGPIDVLTGDWLAELTMLILARQRMKHGAGSGYARTFLTQLEQVLGTCLDRGIRVVSNAGGLDPAGAAAHELEQRRRLDFPPAVRLAVVSGSALAVAEFLAVAALPPSAAVLGPLPLEAGPPGQVRALLRALLADGAALAAALRATQAGRSARKAAEFVSVRVDPVALG